MTKKERAREEAYDRDQTGIARLTCGPCPYAECMGAPGTIPTADRKERFRAWVRLPEPPEVK